MVRVVLVDFSGDVEGRALAALDDHDGVRAVAAGLASGEALDELAELAPDVVILDLGADPDGRVRAVRRACPSACLIARVSGDHATASALEQGANGLVECDSPMEVFVHAIDRVTKGATFLDRRLATRLVRLATHGRRVEGPFGLTLQEMRVLELLPNGLTNRAIAAELGVGEATVKTHLHNAMRKLRVQNRAQAAAVALRNGLA